MRTGFALTTIWLSSLPCLAAPPAPLTLDDLLQAALAHDGRVLAAHAQLDVYRAQLKEAKWLWFPVFRIEGLFGGPVGERHIEFSPTCNDPHNVACYQTSSNERLGDFVGPDFAVGGKIEMAMPLYTFGKLSAAREAAGAGVNAGEEGIVRARQEVALEVRKAYYGWQLATNSLEVLEDGERKIKDAESKLLKMLDELNEEVTDRDLFKLRYYASQVQTLLIQARQGRALALSALGFLTGIEGLGERAPIAADGLEGEAPAIRTREQYLEQARKTRPELRQLQAAVRASQAALEIERAGFYPDFFLTAFVRGSYSPVQDYIENPLLSSSLTSYDAGLALGVRVNLDIPQRMARVDKAGAELGKLRVQARQAEEAVGLEIDKRLADVRLNLDNLKQIRKGHRAAKAWRNANMMSFGVGLTNTKDLLDSIAAYAQSKIEVDKALHNLRVVLDELKATVGESLGREEKPKNPGAADQG